MHRRRVQDLVDLGPIRVIGGTGEKKLGQDDEASSPGELNRGGGVLPLELHVRLMDERPHQLIVGVIHHCQMLRGASVIR